MSGIAGPVINVNGNSEIKVKEKKNNIIFRVILFDYLLIVKMHLLNYSQRYLFL